MDTAPTVSLTSPANNAVFTAPATITLSASANDPDGSIQKVEFFRGGTNLIATVTAAPYTFNWQNVQAGAYTLTAVATDNLGITTTSSPIAITVNQGVAQLYFIHTDHLNTPRLISDTVGQTVWTWANDDPFGNNAPNENPSGLGNFTCNLRLPGQYFDRETNTHYNYFRDYDPSIGRYIQSDPIGLEDGINTYAYVKNNPLSFIDPDGLDATITFYPGGVRHIGIGINSPNTVGLYPRTQSASVAICKDVPGAVLSDPTFQAGSIPGSRSITIKTTLEQDARMQQFINLRQQGGIDSTYNLCSNQCTSFVSQVLQAGGVVLPQSPSALPLNFFNQLRSMYGPGRR